MAKILIVEDQYIEAHNLQLILERAGYHVCTIADSVALALKIIKNEQPDMILLDIQLQGELTGIDLAKTLRDRNTAFIYLSANSDKKTLEQAKATNPNGFLVKPFREKDVLVTLDVAWYLHQENLKRLSNPKKLTSTAIIPETFNRIIGKSKALMEILDNIRSVGPTDTSVLILGETGTGKELIAKSFHQASARSTKPFVIVNCAALPSTLIESELFGHEKGSFTGANERKIGKFEQANEGTVFLDEIGELPRNLQIKFLRVLQEREIERIGGKTFKINVRVIAATNRNLEEEVAAGRFRLDLYYRLNVFPINLPPLRERKEDIQLLAESFITRFAIETGKKVAGLSANILNEMLNHNWPGNIRELENIMERCVLQAKGNTIETLPLYSENPKSSEPGLKDKIKTIEENERDHIIATIKECKGKIYGRGGAAEALNISVSSLNARIKKLGIEKDRI
jgi:two-component system, NtrC family, response regulator HydG